MAVLNHAIKSAEMKFVQNNGYRAPSTWRIQLAVSDMRVNDAFVLLPKTVDQWKNEVRFEDKLEERVALQPSGTKHGHQLFSAEVTVQDTNALDMSKRVVVGFNGGRDWAQSFGDSVKLTEMHGNRD